MPSYKSNLNIFFNNQYLKDPWSMSFMDKEIDYTEVNVWEILHEVKNANQGIDLGVYVAFDPFGELYMITHGKKVITFFGEDAVNDIESYFKENNLDFKMNDKVVINNKPIFEEVK